MASQDSIDGRWRRVQAGLADVEERLRTVDDLATDAAPENRNRLLALLRDSSEDVRAHAIRALAVVRDDVAPPVESECWRLLTEDEDEEVRARAALTLGKVLVLRPSVESFERLTAELRSSAQSLRTKAAIYDLMFRATLQRPDDWPGLRIKRAFRESDIDWSLIASMQRQMAARANAQVHHREQRQ